MIDATQAAGVGFAVLAGVLAAIGVVDFMSHDAPGGSHDPAPPSPEPEEPGPCPDLPPETDPATAPVCGRGV